MKRGEAAESAEICRFFKETGAVRAGTEEEIVHKAKEHSTFSYMKRNIDEIVPQSGRVWEGGAGSFLNKSSNRRCRY